MPPKINFKYSLNIFSRIFFIGVLVFIIGYILSRWTFFITSDQAFINTKLITLRAPIDGIFHPTHISIGNTLSAEASLGEISNPHFGNTDTFTNYENLRNNIDILKNEIDQNIITITKYEIDQKKLARLNETGAIAKDDLEDTEKRLNISKTDLHNKNIQLARLQSNLGDIEKQLNLQKKSTLTTPCSGVLWTILAKDGEQLKYGDEIAQMINPEDLWVDAFFSERYASELTPGMSVKIQALGANRFWKGEVIFVRGGSGRIIYNTAVESPPKGITNRLVAVRIKVDWQNNSYLPSEFYGVGRSVVVVVNRIAKSPPTKTIKYEQ